MIGPRVLPTVKQRQEENLLVISIEERLGKLENEITDLKARELNKDEEINKLKKENEQLKEHLEVIKQQVQKKIKDLTADKDEEIKQLKKENEQLKKERDLYLEMKAMPEDTKKTVKRLVKVTKLECEAGENGNHFMMEKDWLMEKLKQEQKRQQGQATSFWKKFWAFLIEIGGVVASVSVAVLNNLKRL
uniref:Golgin subfamily A member 6-like protein 7 n=1 Tax=Ciona intestinalis TaxID=7719 RepID=F6WE37_CIOIN|nr:golgin subfamily A member 6-like protein 7 [Ciona intestinalis]|eukprot:XP_026694694.1 golgin subfamily A member 6-like protein 7 [Ciona intestinalis]